MKNDIVNSVSVVGHGAYRYKVNKHWGNLDSNKFPVHHCHEMVQTGDGRLFMLNTAPKNNILIYSTKGTLLGTWTLGRTGVHGLTISTEGEKEYLWITDTEAHQVIKTDLEGNSCMILEYPDMIADYTEASLWKPTETAIAPNGDIYVADGYGLNYVVQYDREGQYIRHFGGSGKEDHHLDCCHGVAIDTREGKTAELLVTSRSEQAFKRFTLKGNYLGTVKLPGCWVCRPVIKGDLLYFAVIVTKDWFTYDGAVAILDLQNKVVSMPGANAPVYKAGELEAPESDYRTFLNPHDVCVDDDGNLYIPQWLSGKTYPVKLERI
ncbi:6-bladed beta-propeller [Limibacter armeniacum]|uniref:6-bladed beta-propeller n=1 Tax=Limibacter armeniacum TaxID=466084 RepID=UPI002FE6B914